MKRALVVTIVGMIGVSSLAALVCGRKHSIRDEDMELSSFGVSVVTDKPSYAKGEPIAMTFKVFNQTEERITFHFSDAQRYDFIIEDRKGNKVWRWSDGRMFAQVLGEETLGPGREELSYTGKSN